MTPDSSSAVGFALFCPAMSGACYPQTYTAGASAGIVLIPIAVLFVMMFTTRAIYAGTWAHNFHDRVFRDRDCQPRQTGHTANHCRIYAAAHLCVTHSRGSAGVSCAYRVLLPNPLPAAVVALLLLLGVAIGAYHMPYKLALISACNGCVRVGNNGRRMSELAWCHTRAHLRATAPSRVQCAVRRMAHLPHRVRRGVPVRPLHGDGPL